MGINKISERKMFHVTSALVFGTESLNKKSLHRESKFSVDIYFFPGFTYLYYVLTLLLLILLLSYQKAKETANYLYLWQSSKGGQTNIEYNFTLLCFIMFIYTF